jgi:hypothetical protein
VRKTDSHWTYGLILAIPFGLWHQSFWAGAWMLVVGITAAVILDEKTVDKAEPK